MGNLANPARIILLKIPDVDKQVVDQFAVLLDNLEAMAIAGATIAGNPTTPVVGGTPSNPKYFRVAGETNNANMWQNAGMFWYTDNGTTKFSQIDDSDIFFNDNQGNTDFRINSQNLAPMFVIDASADVSAIGGAVDASYVFKVHGATAIDGDLTFIGAQKIATSAGDLTIDSAGNFVIEDATIIDITGTEALLVRKNSDGGDVLIADTTNSRLGVNIAPEAALHIFGAEGFQIQERVIESTGGGGFTIRKARGTVGSKAIIQDEDRFFGIEAYGYDGANYIIGAEIYARVDGAPGTDDMPGAIIFSTTADGATSTTEAMRITSLGHIGIGNVEPTVFVHLQESLASVTMLLLDNPNSASNAFTRAELKANGGSGSFTTYSASFSVASIQDSALLLSDSNLSNGLWLGTAGSSNASVKIFANGVGTILATYPATGAIVFGRHLEIDQASSTGAAPVLKLDQGDASEQAILISYDAADVDMILIDVDVTGDPQFQWDESQDNFLFTKGITVGGASPTNATLFSVEDGLTFKESSAPTADAGYVKLWSTTVNELFFQSGDGVTHLLHGDAFSNIWFHSASTVEVTISTQSAMTKISSFTVVGHQDDLSNVVGSSANDNLTLSAIAGGEYEISFHASVTATGGADKEMIVALGITLATAKDITNVTDDTVSPIVITSTAHGLENGDMVEIAGVLGNTAANGSFVVDSKATDSFTIVALDGSATTGNGDFDEGSPTGDVTIEYPGNMIVHREVRGADLGAISATGIHVLANSDVLSLHVANIDGTTNLTVGAVSLDCFRIGD